MSADRQVEPSLDSQHPERPDGRPLRPTSLTRARSHVDPTPLTDSDSLPFAPGEEPLRTVLYWEHIVPAAHWLIGHTSTPLLAMQSNSSWETALTMRFLFDVAEIATREGDQERVDLVISLITPVTTWLLDQCHVHDDDSACWDHVTWDTAAVVATLADTLSKYSLNLSTDIQALIEHRILGSLSWLCTRFEHWPDQVKYPFGDADVAQIAIAMVKVATSVP